ncbi:MAG: class I SAM-dependent DNA methyltransferase [Clostridiaceae bacterium]|nr:class I SAM-dependent DNA methyltransferase [Clostridiaceae bacterium]
MSFTNGESWVVLSEIEQRIKAKIEAIGTPLKDWDINIYRGVLTGFNEAFIINGQKKDEILANCKDDAERIKTDELIRPILRGRDIKRYSYEFADLWLINTHNGLKEKDIKPINIDDYPAVKQHLDKYFPQLEKRQDKGDTPYNLRNCAYIEDFYKQKIIYSELSQGSCFILDDTCKMFILQTGYIIVGNKLEYLLALLNSKLIEWAFRKFYSIELGESAVRWLKQYVENLPIPKANQISENKLKNLILLKEYNKIDEYVYEIFELSTEEINRIKNDRT